MKTIALISGGLDSILAAKFIQTQGIQVLPVNFQIPFCHRQRETRKEDKDILWQVKNNLGTELQRIDIGKEFLELILKPKYGFGSNMNPCLDCKILMLRKAKELMPQLEAAFIITGEVVGQRPMSQYRWALENIAKQAGLEGLVLRPLSAKLLPETIPEREGWVKREKLLDFNGRTRQPQIELAKAFGITDYAQPAGGCLLTDPRFAQRLKDLIAHRELNLANVELLKFGRHFRLAPQAKLVVGRNERENTRLAELAAKNDYLFMPTEELAGPTALGRGEFNPELIEISCRIVCRYCDLNGEVATEIIYSRISEQQRNTLTLAPLDEAALSGLRL